MVKVRLRRRLLLKRHKKSAQSVTYNDGYGGYELPFTGSLSGRTRRISDTHLCLTYNATITERRTLTITKLKLIENRSHTRPLNQENVNKVQTVRL